MQITDRNSTETDCLHVSYTKPVSYTSFREVSILVQNPLKSGLKPTLTLLNKKLVTKSFLSLPAGLVKLARSCCLMAMLRHWLGAQPPGQLCDVLVHSKLKVHFWHSICMHSFYLTTVLASNEDEKRIYLDSPILGKRDSCLCT